MSALPMMFCDIESPTLDDLNDEQKAYLTAWWALADASERPDKREGRQLLHYTDALEELARVNNKRIKPPIDTGVGTGLPSHRKVRVRAA